MSDLAVSFIRTAVPYIVGALVSWLATKGVELDEAASAGLSTFLTALFGSVYYLVFRFLEQKYPELGRFLGVARKPKY